MSTARTAPAGTKADPIVLDDEPPAKPPFKRGRFEVRDSTMVQIMLATAPRNRFQTPSRLESVAKSEAEEGSPSPDPTTESEHSQSSGSSGPVEPETLPEYERGVSDSDESETVCYQCGEPEGGEVTFSVERASGICDHCLREDDGDHRE